MEDGFGVAGMNCSIQISSDRTACYSGKYSRAAKIMLCIRMADGRFCTARNN